MATTSRRLIRRLFHWTASLVLALMVAAFAFVAISQMTGRHRFVPVLSGSMAPFVEAGDVAILEPRAGEDLRVGDVIAFEAPIEGSPLTLHRVFEIVSPAPDLVIRTKGDANDREDPWMAGLVDDQLWRTTGHIDDLGHPVLFLNRAKTRFLLMALAALLIGWWGMVAIWRDPPPSDGRPGGGPELRPVRRRTAALQVVGVVAVLGSLVFGLHIRGAQAAFTDTGSGRQAVTSARTVAPMTLEAKVDCIATDATSVTLTWSSSVNRVNRFIVSRGTSVDGPFTEIGFTNWGAYRFTDPIPEGTDPLSLFYVITTDDKRYPTEQSNVASAPETCAAEAR